MGKRKPPVLIPDEILSADGTVKWRKPEGYEDEDAQKPPQSPAVRGLLWTVGLCAWVAFLVRPWAFEHWWRPLGTIGEAVWVLGWIGSVLYVVAMVLAGLGLGR